MTIRQIAGRRMRCAIVFATVAGLLSACDPGSSVDDVRPVVVVSIAPQAFLIERMTGGRINVRTMIEPGRSPEEFQPLPQQLAAIADAKYYFAIGLPFEQVWLSKLAEAHPNIEIISAAIDVSANDGDPHHWTNPRNAISLVQAAVEPLKKLLPESSLAFADSHRNLVDELEILDRRIQTLMDEQTSHRFLVYHPAWSHFAARYGLEQVAFEQDGKQPGARYLSELLALCRANSVQTVFVQPHSPSDQVRRFTTELGATAVMVDPLQYDYVDNLWEVAQVVAGELW